MTSQPCFSSRLPRIDNPNHSTPWGRYRHGCDPPDYQRRSKARGPTWTSILVSCRFVHHNAFFSFLLTFRSFSEHPSKLSTAIVSSFSRSFSQWPGPPPHAVIVMHGGVGVDHPFLTRGRDIQHLEEETNYSHMKS